MIDNEENVSDYTYSAQFDTLWECFESGQHLESVDDDGYCNNCGFQEMPEDVEFDQENSPGPREAP